VAWDNTERRFSHRRLYDAARAYGREELSVLLESHRDAIQSSTTLLERIEKLFAHLDQQRAELAALHKGIETLAADGERLAEQLRTHAQETYREHHGHRLRLYGAYVGLVTIILALIGLLAKIWPGGMP
jgi:hypothetical protein